MVTGTVNLSNIQGTTSATSGAGVQGSATQSGAAGVSGNNSAASGFAPGNAIVACPLKPLSLS
jgi:hypothetical protein